MGRRTQSTPVLVLVALVLGAGLLLVVPTALGEEFRALVHFRQPSRILPAVPLSDTGGHYAFEQTQPGSRDPVTYNPCKPIRYVVNASAGPSDALAFISAAVAVISTASGLSFEDDGVTDDTNFEHRSAGDPVLIGFVAPGEIEGMTVESRHIGLGGSTAYDVGFGHRAYRTGMVALRSDWFGDKHISEAEKQAVVMHELGHVVGLDHVKDVHELMAAENTGVTALGPGDREGLALLGRGQCR
jgi:hypothetical protein